VQSEVPENPTPKGPEKKKTKEGGDRYSNTQQGGEGKVEGLDRKKKKRKP